MLFSTNAHAKWHRSLKIRGCDQWGRENIMATGYGQARDILETSASKWKPLK